MYVMQDYPHKCTISTISSELWKWTNSNIGFQNYEWTHIVENHKSYFVFEFRHQCDMTQFYLTWG